MNPGVTVSNLVLARGSLNVLDRASFSVARGETVALIGASGIGKSSLMAAIAGLLDSSSGSIEVEGTPVTTEHPPIGHCVLMPQDSDNLILPWRSVKGHFGVTKLNQMETEAFTRAVGLFDKLNFKPRKLSGGQQRRLALAVTFAAKLPVVLLDEPFAGLDIDVMLRCWDFVEAQAKECNASVLIITHSIEQAAVLADRVFVFERSNDLTTLDVLERASAGALLSSWKDKKPSLRYLEMDINGSEKFADILRKRIARI